VIDLSDNSYVNLARNVNNPHAGDERLHVEFKFYPLQNMEKTEKEGRPVFDDVEFVKILTPGDKDIYFQPASFDDKTRFRRQYEDFKANREAAISGTPLHVIGMSEAAIAEYAYFRIRTVEQMADVSDAVAVRAPGTYEWRRKAQAFVTAAKEQAPLIKAQAELEKRDDQIAALKKQLDELAAAIAAKSPKKIASNSQ
jgi:hypothetical protein